VTSSSSQRHYGVQSALTPVFETAHHPVNFISASFLPVGRLMGTDVNRSHTAKSWGGGFGGGRWAAGAPELLAGHTLLVGLEGAEARRRWRWGGRWRGGGWCGVNGGAGGGGGRAGGLERRPGSPGEGERETYFLNQNIQQQGNIIGRKISRCN